MDQEIVVLTAAAASTLIGIGDSSEQGEVWCRTVGLDEAVLKELEREAYITRNGAQNTARITALGKLALDNHIVKGTPEHGQILLNGNRRAPQKPFAGVMRSPNAAPPTAPQRVCRKEGCGDPRMVSKAGQEQPYCPPHQQEYWREQAGKQREKKLSEKIQRLRPESVPASGVTTVSTPPAAEEPRMAEAACGDCDTPCIHREVLDMLRGKFPKINELVETMEKVRTLQQSLGIEA
jgi:hypothetical protein